MTADYTDEMFEANGCRLHYQDWGNPEAPPLVMVHGLTQQSHAFDGPARRLRDQYHCMALDVRGRGESAWADRATYNYTQYADDLLAFLDAKAGGQAHYIGTSMGGLIGMVTATREPERFQRFVLNDIGPELALPGVQLIAGYLAKAPPSFPSLAAYVDEMCGRFPWLASLPRDAVETAMHWAVRQNEDGSWVVKHDPHIVQGRLDDPEALKQVAAVHWDGFKKLTCPILLVRGDETQLLAMSTVEAMQAAQPGMAFVRVPGVGHPPSLNEPPAADGLKTFFG